MQFNPIRKIIGDKYSRNKKVFVMQTNAYRDETGTHFDEADPQPRLVDDSKLLYDMKLPFIEPSGSWLETYDRRGRKKK